MISGSTPCQRKYSLSKLVANHLIELGDQATVVENQINSSDHLDLVLVRSAKFGFIHITSTGNEDIESSILVADFKGEQKYLTDKNYVAYGWNHLTGSSIYFVEADKVKGRWHFKKSEIRASSSDYLNAQIRI